MQIGWDNELINAQGKTIFHVYTVGFTLHVCHLKSQQKTAPGIRSEHGVHLREQTQPVAVKALAITLQWSDSGRTSIIENTVEVVWGWS